MPIKTFTDNTDAESNHHNDESTSGDIKVQKINSSDIIFHHESPAGASDSILHQNGISSEMNQQETGSDEKMIEDHQKDQENMNTTVPHVEIMNDFIEGGRSNDDEYPDGDADDRRIMKNEVNVPCIELRQVPIDELTSPKDDSSQGNKSNIGIQEKSFQLKPDGDDVIETAADSIHDEKKSSRKNSTHVNNTSDDLTKIDMVIVTAVDDEDSEHPNDALSHNQLTEDDDGVTKRRKDSRESGENDLNHIEFDTSSTQRFNHLCVNSHHSHLHHHHRHHHSLYHHNHSHHHSSTSYFNAHQARSSLTTGLNYPNDCFHHASCHASSKECRVRASTCSASIATSLSPKRRSSIRNSAPRDTSPPSPSYLTTGGSGDPEFGVNEPIVSSDGYTTGSFPTKPRMSLTNASLKSGNVADGMDDMKQHHMICGDRVDALPKDMSFTWIDILAIVFSICSFLFDITTDTVVAAFHLRNGDYWYFSLTTSFIVIPTLVMTGISLRWYVLDAREEGSPKISTFKWFTRTVFLLLQLGPILRYFDSLIYGLKFRRNKKNKSEQKKYFQYMVYEDTDATMLRLFECFMEAAPQLVLQIYILAKKNHQPDDFLLG